MTHLLSTKFSLVNLPPYHDNDARNTLFSSMIRHIREIINVHQRWDPHELQGLYVISALEHVEES